VPAWVEVLVVVIVVVMMTVVELTQLLGRGRKRIYAGQAFKRYKKMNERIASEMIKTYVVSVAEGALGKDGRCLTLHGWGRSQ
jgi:hypothetical protein